MKRLAIAVIAAALIWAGFWMLQAQSLRSATEAWFDARRAEGWQAAYSDLSLRGFPNRLDVTLADVTLQAPDGPLWQAPFFQSFQLVYRPSHRIFAFSDRMTLGDLTVVSQGLRASMVDDGSRVLRANLEAEVLNLEGGEQALALAGVTAALVDVGDATYQLSLAADGIAGPDGAVTGGASDGVRMRAHVGFDRPWDSSGMLQTRPQPTRLTLDLLEVEQGALTLKLAGDLEIDSAGRGTGRLTLRAQNWRDLLASAQANGQLSPGIAQVLTDGLELYARLTGNGQDLDLPLDFRGGDLWLGPVPLGEAPRFRLP